MTFKEASARIEDHMIVHRMGERNAVKITEALEIAVKLLAWAERQPVIIFESDIADIINEYYNNGLRDGFRRAERFMALKASVMEEIKKVEIMTERIEHHFWCDECGGYMGHTEELDDGYYPRLGEYELKFYLDGWYRLKKTICPACYMKFFDKIRERLFEIGFTKD